MRRRVLKHKGHGEGANTQKDEKQMELSLRP